jgi:hypothetical protein
MSRSEKGHRNRKNPGSAEFFKKQRKERNTARPKQDLVTTVVHHEDGTNTVTHTRVRD